MPRRTTKVTFNLPPDLYDHALTKATAQLLTVDDYLQQRIIRALEADAAKTLAPAPPADRPRSEPIWKKSMTAQPPNKKP